MNARSKIAAVAALLLVIAGCRGAPACPPGATLKGAAPPEGFEVWCEKSVNRKPVKDGRFTLYGAGGGKMIEGYYHNGVQVGEWTMWYDNGQRASIDHYRNGMRNGPHISWYANGAKAIEGDYRNGKRNGVWLKWDPNGLKNTHETYQDGKQIK
jgi:MORN repeat variant